MRIIGRAVKLPINVKTNAGKASALNSIFWPGRIESNVSSFGAPRKIEGM